MDDDRRTVGAARTLQIHHSAGLLVDDLIAAVALAQEPPILALGIALGLCFDRGAIDAQIQACGGEADLRHEIVTQVFSGGLHLGDGEDLSAGAVVAVDRGGGPGGLIDAIDIDGAVLGAGGDQGVASPGQIDEPALIAAAIVRMDDDASSVGAAAAVHIHQGAVLLVDDFVAAVALPDKAPDLSVGTGGRIGDHAAAADRQVQTASGIADLGIEFLAKVRGSPRGDAAAFIFAPFQIVQDQSLAVTAVGGDQIRVAAIVADLAVVVGRGAVHFLHAVLDIVLDGADVVICAVSLGDVRVAGQIDLGAEELTASPAFLKAVVNKVVVSTLPVGATIGTGHVGVVAHVVLGIKEDGSHAAFLDAIVIIVISQTGGVGAESFAQIAVILAVEISIKQQIAQSGCAGRTGGTGRTRGAGGTGGTGGTSGCAVAAGCCRHITVVAVNAIIAAVLGPQLGGGIVGALQLGRSLLGDLDPADPAAGVTQAGDEHNVAHGVGVQSVAQLELLSIGAGRHAQIGGDLRQRVGGAPANAPAVGDEGGAVRCVIWGGGTAAMGSAGVEDAVGILGRGLESIHRHAKTYVGTGVDRLAIWDTVGIACVEGASPSLHGTRTVPGGIVQIIRTVDDVLLAGCGSTCRGRCQADEHACHKDHCQQKR